MVMRDFWNLHSLWTLQISDHDGLPMEAVAAAATHHFLDGQNPQGIIGDNYRFSGRFGNNKSYDREEKLVTILDKYDAFRRRGMLSHDESIERVMLIIEGSIFEKDVEFIELMKVLDSMEKILDSKYY